MDRQRQFLPLLRPGSADARHQSPGILHRCRLALTGHVRCNDRVACVIDPLQVIVVVATSLFSHWQESPWAQAAIHGAIAAAVAITVKTCWTIAHPHVRTGTRLRVALIATAAFLLYVWGMVPAVQVLLIAAVVGALLPPVPA